MWQLELGGEIIAILYQDEFDFPWTYATLAASPKFERFRCYFSDSDHWPDTDEFASLCAEIQARGHFMLRNQETGEVFHHVSLHHDGDHAWFRYS